MINSIGYYTEVSKALYTDCLRKSDDMNLLSDRIKLILDEHPELDQVSLGVAASASKAVVNHWIAGRVKSIDIEAALSIEQNLQYNHIWLMTGRGEKLASNNINYGANSTIFKILHVAEEMNEYKRNLALDLMQALSHAPNLTPEEIIEEAESAASLPAKNLIKNQKSVQ